MRLGRWHKGAALFLISLFVVSFLPSQVAANPAVPYCGPASAAGALSATSDQVQPETCMDLTGRVFPEALFDTDYVHDDPAPGPAEQRGYVCSDTTPTGSCTGWANDYVGFFEFQAGLQYLAEQHPDLIEIHEVAMSRGLENVAGGPSKNPIYVLEISNEDSPIPRDQKQNLLFMLSIHGNEKGGREGGFRVAEDLLRNIGFARETVQNGAGLSTPITKPTGGEVQTYHDYLDFMNVFLLFPNSDGWACDEIEYAGGPGNPLGGGGCPGLFTRGNGNGVDLNRQTPTIGWHNPNRNVLGEPEAGGDGEYPGFANWLVDQRSESNGTFQWDYAIDIHGMLNHKNFGAIMLPAGSFSPQEMHRSLRLAESLKERWNLEAEGGGHFAEWGTLFSSMETAWAVSGPGRDAAADGIDAACGGLDICPQQGSALSGTLHDDESPTTTASSSQFAEYYTVIDAIGYTDSGFNGDFFAQTTGLNAPGYDIELAYNHLNCSAQYEPPCNVFNDYHVWMVRHIVKSFMDAAAVDAQISYETAGLKTAYIPSGFVATNLDDVDENGEPMLTPGGWADENPNDDAWDYGPDQPFHARPAKYWEDIKPFVCESCGTDGALPGVLEARDADQITAANLANFDNLIIAGSAINQLVEGNAGENEVANGTVDQAKIDIIQEWVHNGGNLVLTDAALEYFDLAGLTQNGVERETGYMGGIRMDLSHPFLDKIRGGVKQTYEPTPLGYGTSGASPNWGIDPDQFAALEGSSVAGLVCPGSSLSQNCQGRNIGLGYVDLGEGRISFMGAILPDPTEEFYHPYGLDNYATTFSGNQIVRNMLGWDEVFAEPPITIAEDGQIVQSPNEPTASAEDLDGTTGGDDSTKDSPGVGIFAALVLLGAFALRRRR